MMKKSLSFVMFLFVALFSLVGCGNGDNPKYDKNQKVNAGDVPWEVSMGINDYGDRALMIKFTNNSKYVITELSLEFTLKDNLKDKELEEFYSYLAREYDLDSEEKEELMSYGVTMDASVYMWDEEDYLQVGDTIEDSLNYGYMYIRTMDYYDYFKPDIYKIEYLDENGKECTVYYDYINRTYSNK